MNAPLGLALASVSTAETTSAASARTLSTMRFLIVILPSESLAELSAHGARRTRGRVVVDVVRRWIRADRFGERRIRALPAVHDLPVVVRTREEQRLHDRPG